jgi:tricorn protease-like protein
MTVSYAGVEDVSSIYSKDDVGYDKFFDMQDEYRLVLKDNDLYVYDMEGIDKRRITHTPKINKPEASFSKDRSYILYTEVAQEDSASKEPKYYRIDFTGDDNSKILISAEEYMSLAKGN